MRVPASSFGPTCPARLPAHATLAQLDKTKVSQFIFGKLDECDTRVPIGFQLPKGILDALLTDSYPPQEVEQVIFSLQVLARYESPRASGTDWREYDGVSGGTWHVLRRAL